MDLPDEVLADILSRVVPLRHLAECRRVCARWRATIDGRRLVLPHLLPGAPRGAFINFTADGWSDTYFFARGGGSGGDVDARLADAPTRWCTAFVDHCNGLLLCEATEGARFVYNPATRRSATLPPPPHAEPWGVASAAYLVFDPAVSLHHKVFLLPELTGEPEPPKPNDPPPPMFNVARLFFADSAAPPQIDSDEDDGEDWLYTEDEPRWRSRAGRREHLQAKEAKDTLGLMEWPPLLYVAQVFSSMTGRWEERTFVREGSAAGTVADMWSDPPSPNYGCAVPQCGPRRRHSVYWRRSLYVHCRGGFIIRLSLLTGKYVVIKTPEVAKLAGHRWATPYLSKSRKGVYYTAVADVNLWIWVLNEEPTTVPPRWEMVHQADLRPSLRQLSYESNQEKNKSWILDDPLRRESVEPAFREWDSDDDDDDGGDANVAEQASNNALNQYMGWLDVLGYHPHKEIVFFGYQHKHRAFAYHLRTCKLEYLGCPAPISDDPCFPAYVQESFVYAPCRIDMLSDRNGTSVDLSNWVRYASQ
ncbi:hypothetical protein QYE76_071610 [Lolium multiflorum]|uniref:F-box domain-containing protein n=1 Tax=Lolium multiflorum TaxID=4521 RepID=A0AAD8SML0_LOLMU|nr:hypothetical protein QYE76_071610 [Lolium multiflorum]